MKRLKDPVVNEFLFKAVSKKGLSVIGVQQIDRIVEVVEETLKGNSVRLMGKKKKDNKKYGGAQLNLPKVRRNPLIEIIAINTGCLNECTYCKTKHARGELGNTTISMNILSATSILTFVLLKDHITQKKSLNGLNSHSLKELSKYG